MFKPSLQKSKPGLKKTKPGWKTPSRPPRRNVQAKPSQAWKKLSRGLIKSKPSQARLGKVQARLGKAKARSSRAWKCPGVQAIPESPTHPFSVRASIFEPRRALRRGGGDSVLDLTGGPKFQIFKIPRLRRFFLCVSLVKSKNSSKFWPPAAKCISISYVKVKF